MLRSAVTVVSRSSCVSTGTPTTVASRAGLGDGSLGGVPDLAAQRQRQPDDDQLDVFVVGDPGDLVEVTAARRANGGRP